MNLEGKVIVVTGAFGSLGRAVAQAAAGHGARLALIDRAAAPAAGLPAQSMVLGEVDLATEAAAKQAINAVAGKLGGIDALVNVAGTFRWETLEAGNPETWDLLYNVNLRSAVCASKAALPHLLVRGAGRIVNIGANAAGKASAGMGAYAASKSGVARLTEALAEELKDRNVTVNAVLPSVIDTPPNRRDMPDADFSRWVKPDDLAGVILFLLSDASRPVTGALIPVTGRV